MTERKKRFFNCGTEEVEGEIESAGNDSEKTSLADSEDSSSVTDTGTKDAMLLTLLVSVNLMIYITYSPDSQPTPQVTQTHVSSACQGHKLCDSETIARRRKYNLNWIIKQTTILTNKIHLFICLNCYSNLRNNQDIFLCAVQFLTQRA